MNPHNQTFAVAIQLGVIGALALWAMWIVHLGLFRGEGLVAWFGLVLVVENILSSAVHTHLFDFNNGWLYVFGTGVLWRNDFARPPRRFRSNRLDSSKKGVAF